VDQRCGESIHSAFVVTVLEDTARCLCKFEIRRRCTAASGKLPSERGGNAIDEDFRACGTEIVQGNEALTEAISAAPSTENQRHCGGGNGSKVVADQPLENPRLAAAASRSRCGRNPFLVCAPDKQRHQSRLIEQPGAGQRLNQNRIAVVVSSDPAVRKCCPERIGNVTDEAMQHCRHERPFLLGQPLLGIEEEVEAHGSQAAASR
jgi:hypothetical protein